MSDPRTLRFSVLGPVRAWCGDSELDLGPPQQRATLAVLLVRAKRPASIGEIADVLWGQNLPASAINVIHRHIGMLRRLLEPQLPSRVEGERLVRVSGGYRLKAGTDDVDLTRFRRLRERAREANGAGDAETAVDRFVEAALLWQGPVVAGIPAAARGHRLFTALDDEYLLTVREASTIALRFSLADRVLNMLERCAARHPLDEGVHARLALALAATGHQAEALDLCHLTRTRLARELGVTPGEELRAAHESVLGGQPGGRGTTVGQGGLQSERGLASSRRASGAVHMTLPDLSTAQSSPGAVPGARPHTWHGPGPAPQPRPGAAVPRLTGRRPQAALGEHRPSSPPAFIGRRAEIAELLAMAAGARPGHETVAVAAICGQAGVGKTALMDEAARWLVDQFPDGVIRFGLRGFDPLRPLIPPGEAVRELLKAVGVPPCQMPEDPDDVDAHAAVWRSVLSGRRLLLLFDDARDAAHVRPLLPGANGCMVLVSSRNTLSGLVEAEGAHRIVLGPLAPTESHALLATRVDPHHLTGDQAEADRLVSRCAGLPLALHQAAARPKAGQAESVTARTGVDMPEGDLDAMRRALSGTYRVLAPAPARLFRLLALYDGSDLSTAAIAALADLEIPQVRSLLSTLADLHLVDERAPGRFGLRPHEHAYARELVFDEDSEETRVAAVDRLRGHFLCRGMTSLTMTVGAVAARLLGAEPTSL